VGKSGDLEVRDNRKVRQMCDMSAISFFKIITETRKAKKLRKYREHEKLLERMPGYEVKFGSGLHIGWAIEGAIGSFYKIDASYLSPHVKICEMLEGATKLYGVPVLISGEIRALMSPDADQYFRQVDSVKFNGSGQVLHLYTIDIDMSEVDTDFSQITLTRKQAKLRRVKAKLNRERYKAQCVDATISANSKWETDPDLVRVRTKVSRKFIKTWEEAFSTYQRGNWQEAKLLFEEVHVARGHEDKPTLNLQNVMKETNYQVPSGWIGIRSTDGI
jgi:hypothetical protein